MQAGNCKWQKQTLLYSNYDEKTMGGNCGPNLLLRQKIYVKNNSRLLKKSLFNDYLLYFVVKEVFSFTFLNFSQNGSCKCM